MQSARHSRGGDPSTEPMYDAGVALEDAPFLGGERIGSLFDAVHATDGVKEYYDRRAPEYDD